MPYAETFKTSTLEVLVPRSANLILSKPLLAQGSGFWAQGLSSLLPPAPGVLKQVLESEPGAVGTEPGAAQRKLGMIGGDQGPEARGVVALLEMGELVHDDVVEHVRRGHDQMGAKAE